MEKIKIIALHIALLITYLLIGFALGWFFGFEVGKDNAFSLCDLISTNKGEWYNFTFQPPLNITNGSNYNIIIKG